MKKEEIVNRLSGLFEQGMDTVQSVKGEMEEKWRTGTRAVEQARSNSLSTGERYFGTMKQHPAAFLIGGMSLIGFLAATLLFDIQRRRSLLKLHTQTR